MITKLTKEQEEQIPVYIDKWIKQASVPMNEVKAIKYTKQLYKRMEEKEPIVIIGDSPFSTALLAALYFSLCKNLKRGAKLQLRFQLGSQLGSQLRSQLYSQLDFQLGSQLHSKLHSQLYSQLDSQLGSQLHSQLHSQLYSQLRSQLKSINNDWYLNIWWLIWNSWYEYGKMLGVTFDDDIYNLFVNFNSEVNFIIPYNGIVFISRKPEYIGWKGKVLHCETGPAVRYKDGYSLFTLNGVKVPEWLVTTHSDALDPKKVLDIENADQRAEGIRKLGIERLVQYGKVKDTYKNYDDAWFDNSKYELIDMAPIFKTIKYAPYLKMLNQSVPGVWHLEAVSKECQTVQDAVNFRTKSQNPILRAIK